MPTLLLRLAGPMQSWGTRSRFDDRDTERTPTKSGVVGLLCAALGRPREESLVDLAALRMGVRVDRPGLLETDFHTALDVAKASGARGSTVISRRHYLADAQFLVGLEGPEALLNVLHAALQRPKWSLFLGRKSFPPGLPVALPDGLQDASLEAALEVYPWLPELHYRQLLLPRRYPPGSLEVEVEAPFGSTAAETRQDQPLCFAVGQREHGARRLCRLRVPTPGATPGAPAHAWAQTDFFTEALGAPDGGPKAEEDNVFESS